jgi:DNA-binding SARP family transcriptional activator/WD40 repeat protein
VDIGVLGPVRVDDGGPLEPRDRTALTVLVVLRGQVVAPDRFAEALWGEHPPASWAKQVQICIGRLRKRLGPAAIQTVSGGYRLGVDDEDLDAVRFEQLVTRAGLFRAAGQADRAASSYARALALWRGPPLAETDGWLPGRIEAARLEELRRTAEEELLDARLAAGEHREVAVEAEALSTAEPLRERRWAILALARYRCGRQADALHAIRTARRTLGDQLGLDLGVELAALEAAILRQDPSLAAAPERASVSEACPYKGLAPYDSADADAFFGRDGEVAACLERLRTTPLLVITGPSGCGKSSLLRAGVVPALHRRGRSTVVFTPGQDPQAALVDALASAADGAVLAIDQFEEMFAPGSQPEVVRHVCQQLAEYASDRGPVVLAVRSDHLGGLSADVALSRLVEQGLHLVIPLAGDLLREAIEQPAAGAGLRLEPGLVDLLVRDCEGEPGALPLLSHALAETWRRRDGNVLTVEGYRASGGIRGAVARSADRLYDSLPPEQRTMVRSVLLRLVTSSPGGDPVRTPIASRTLFGDPDRERVLALLVRSRLVTAEQDTFEVAHEALARAWPRLATWLEDDTAGQRILRHLATSAEGWESLGRPRAELYRGARLDTALEWREATDPDLTPLERDFLEASVEQAASESRLLADRARRDARQNRRLRALVAATTVLLLVSSTAGVVAVRGRQAAREQRDVARAAQDEAELEALINRSLGLRSTNRSVAALLAVEAYRRQPDARAWSALLATFTASPSFLGYRYLPGTRLDGDVVPGTRSAVVAFDDGTLGVLDLESGELDRRFPPYDSREAASLVRVSADGRVAVQYLDTSDDAGCQSEPSAGTDERWCGAVAVFDIATGRPLLEPVQAPFPVDDIAIDADGTHLAVAGGPDGEVAVHRVDDGTLLGMLAGLTPPDGIAPDDHGTAAVVFGPEGELYVGSLAGPIRVLDPVSLEVTRTLDGPPMSSHNHLVMPSDDLLIGGGSSSLVAIDSATGETRWTADVRTGIHPEPCPWLTVAATPGRLYCGNLYGVIEERDLTTGARTGVSFDPQLGRVGDLAVAADGRELVAFGDEAAAVSRWRLDGSGLVARVVAEGHVVSDGWDPTGEQLLVGRRDPAATVDTDFAEFALWDPTTDEPHGVLTDVEGMGWAGDGTLFGFALDSETLEFYSADTDAILHGVDVPLDSDHSWPSAGGRYSYHGFPDQIWTIDVGTRRRVEPTIPVDGFPEAVSATRDGDRVVVTAPGPAGFTTTVHDGRTGAPIAGPLVGPKQTSVSLDGVLVGATAGAVTTYDLDTLEPIATLPGARGEINTLQFSRDSSVLLATSNDQTVSVYDVASGTRLGDPIPSAAPHIYPGFLHPDGHRVAVTVREGVAIWDIDPDHLAAAACELAGRNLTDTEWTTYLSGLGGRRATCHDFAS